MIYWTLHEAGMWLADCIIFLSVDDDEWQSWDDAWSWKSYILLSWCVLFLNMLLLEISSLRRNTETEGGFLSMLPFHTTDMCNVLLLLRQMYSVFKSVYSWRQSAPASVVISWLFIGVRIPWCFVCYQQRSTLTWRRLTSPRCSSSSLQWWPGPRASPSIRSVISLYFYTSSCFHSSMLHSEVHHLSARWDVHLCSVSHCSSGLQLLWKYSVFHKLWQTCQPGKTPHFTSLPPP